MRLYEHGLAKLLVYVISEQDMLLISAKVFVSSFPGELRPWLQDMEDPSASVPADPAAKKQKLDDAQVGGDCEDDIDFDDVDVDADPFQEAVLTTEELQRRQAVKHLISDAANEQAKIICCILWPDRFRDDIENILEKINSGTVLPWVAQSQNNMFWKSSSSSLRSLPKMCRDSKGFVLLSTNLWSAFIECDASTSTTVASLRSREPGAFNIRGVSQWSRTVAKNLRLVTKVSESFASLHARYPDQRVQGNVYATLRLWRRQFVRSFNDVVEMAKLLVLSTLSLCDGMGNVAGRVEVVDTSQKLAAELLNVIANTSQAAGDSMVPANQDKDQPKQRVEKLQDRLREVSTLFGSVVDVCKEHYTTWETPLLQESPSEISPDLQESYNNLSAQTKDFFEGMQVGGRFAWVRHASRSLVPFFAKPLLLETEVPIMEILQWQQQAT